MDGEQGGARTARRVAAAGFADAGSAAQRSSAHLLSVLSRPPPTALVVEDAEPSVEAAAGWVGNGGQRECSNNGGGGGGGSSGSSSKLPSPHGDTGVCNKQLNSSPLEANQVGVASLVQQLEGINGVGGAVGAAHKDGGVLVGDLLLHLLQGTHRNAGQAVASQCKASAPYKQLTNGISKLLKLGQALPSPPKPSQARTAAILETNLRHKLQAALLSPPPPSATCCHPQVIHKTTRCTAHSLIFKQLAEKSPHLGNEVQVVLLHHLLLPRLAVVLPLAVDQRHIDAAAPLAHLHGLGGEGGGGWG